MGLQQHAVERAGGTFPTVDLIDTIRTIDAADWDACAATSDPFAGHAFLKALEDSGTISASLGRAPLHLTLRAPDGRLDAVAPVYLKRDSVGEYWWDQGWAAGYDQAGGRYYPKLLIGPPFAPVSGRRLLVRPGAPARTADLMVQTLEHVARSHGLSSIHAIFPDEADRERLEAAGWLVRHDFQYDWTDQGYGDFAGFLGALNANRRGMIRHERRAVADSGIGFRTVTGDEATPEDWSTFIRLFDDLHRRRQTPQPLTADFFRLLGAALGGRVLLTFGEEAGQAVAAAVLIRSGDCLYVRHWGCLPGHKFLHFEMCYYRAIEHALSCGLRRIEGGYGGPHKLARGFLPKLTHSLHWFLHSNLRTAVADFLERERAEVLQRFAEAQALSPFRRADGPRP